MWKCILLNEKNLAKQPLFWLSIGLPILSFIVLGSFVWFDYKPGFNEVGYGKFLEVSKLPLLCLSLSVPLVAIIAHIHRTIQTEKQIAHTQEQISNTQRQITLLEEKNRPDSYYAHVKSITEALVLIPGFSIPRLNIKNHGENTIKTSIKYPHPLYKKIFHKSNVKNGYNVEISEQFSSKIKKNYDDLNDILFNAIHVHIEYELLNSINVIEKILISFCAELSISYEYEGHVFTLSHDASNQKISTSFSNENEIKSLIKGIRKTLISLYRLLDIDDSFLHDNNYIVQYITTNRLIFEEYYPISLRETLS